MRKSINIKPQDISHQQHERTARRRAETLAIDRDHNVRVSVDELEKRLQAPEAASA